MSTGCAADELKDGHTAHKRFPDRPCTVEADGWQVVFGACQSSATDADAVSDVSEPSVRYVNNIDEGPKKPSAGAKGSLMEWLIKRHDRVAHAQNDILQLEQALKYERHKLKDLQPKKRREAVRAQQAHVVHELEDRLCDTIRSAAIEQARFVNTMRLLLCSPEIQPLMSTMRIQEVEQDDDVGEERRTFDPLIQNLLTALGEIDIARERIDELHFSRAVEASMEKLPEFEADEYAAPKLRDEVQHDEALCGLEAALREAEGHLSVAKAKCIAAGLDPDHEVAQIREEVQHSEGDP